MNDNLVERLRAFFATERPYQELTLTITPDQNNEIHRALALIQSQEREIAELKAWLVRVTDEYEETEYYRPDTIRNVRDFLARKTLGEEK